MPLGKKIVEPPSWTNDIQWIHSTAGEVKFGPKGKASLKRAHCKSCLPDGSKVTIIKPPNKYGVYEALVQVEYDGVIIGKKSTMWPDNMGSEDIYHAVDFAFANKFPDEEIPNGFIGTTKEGISVQFYLDDFDGSYNFHALYEK